MKKYLRHNYFVFLMGIFIIVIFMFPLLRNISSYYNEFGDLPLCGWILWYVQDSIKTGRIFDRNAFFNSNQFYGLSDSLAFSESMVVPGIIFSIIYWTFNNLIASVNIYVFLTFIFSYITSYLTIKYFVKNTLSSVVGALVYTINPLVLYHFGHVQLFNRFFIPLLFLYGYKFITSPNRESAFKFGLVFTLNALSAVYFEAMSIVLIPIFFVPYILFNFLKKNWVYFVNLFKSSLVFLLFIPFIIYFNLPYLLFSQNEGVVRTLDDNVHFSARVIDYFTFPVNNLFKRDAFPINRQPQEPSGGFNYSEHTLFLGFVGMFLFSFFLIWGLKKCFRKNQNKLLFMSLGLVLIICFILTFGPFFCGWNNNVCNFGVKLPFYYLYKIFLFKSIRVPTRFQFYFYVPFTILISYGYLILSSKIKKTSMRVFVFLVVIVLIFVENYNPVNRFDGKAEDYLDIGFYKSLNLKDKVVLHLPVKNSYTNSYYLTLATISNERLVNGYSGYYPNDWFSLMKYYDDFQNIVNVTDYKAFGINNILIHKSYLSDEDENTLSSLRDFYKNMIIVENNDLLVLDLDKAETDYRFCEIEDVQFSLSKYIIDSKLNWQALIVNNSDCYIRNLYENRYEKVKVWISDSKYKEFVLKKPLIVLPHTAVRIDGDFKFNNIFLSNKIKIEMDNHIFEHSLGNSMDIESIIEKVQNKKGDNLLYEVVSKEEYTNSILFKIKNIGKLAWPGEITLSGKGSIRLALNYYDSKDNKISNEILPDRCFIPFLVNPGEDVIFYCGISSNLLKKEGAHYFSVSLVDELVRWSSKEEYVYYLDKPKL